MIDRLGNEVPAEALAFAQWLEANGWYYVREWTWPGDYNGYIVEEGFWTESACHDIVKQWPREDDVWHFCLSVTEHIYAREAIWSTFLELAKATSEQERISCRVPFTFSSVRASSDGASE